MRARRLRAALGLVRSGACAVALHRARSAVTVASVAAIVLPFVVGLGISGGLSEEVERALRLGPDLLVSGERFGRPAPVPLAAGEALRAIPGVTEVTPRIVGEMRLGTAGESVVVVGLPAEGLPREISAVEGRLFRAGARNEIVAGREVADRLGLRVGTVLPPFYRNERGERLSRIVGIFRSEAPLWQSRTLLVSLETAADLFAEDGVVTDFLVRCRPNFEGAVADHVRRMDALPGAPGGPASYPKVLTRGEMTAALSGRILDRETLFLLPFVLAFAVGVPVVLVTSGIGLTERKREAALLRTLGWSRDALLLRALVESTLLGLLGGAVSVIGGAVWLSVFGGAGIAPVLLPGAARSPGFRVPFDLGAVPVLLAFLMPLVIVGTGSLVSTWRAATAAPAEVLR